jgi:hypothetical protein
MEPGHSGFGDLAFRAYDLPELSAMGRFARPHGGSAGMDITSRTPAGDASFAPLRRRVIWAGC